MVEFLWFWFYSSSWHPSVSRAVLCPIPFAFLPLLEPPPFAGLCPGRAAVLSHRHVPNHRHVSTCPLTSGLGNVTRPSSQCYTKSASYLPPHVRFSPRQSQLPQHRPSLLFAPPQTTRAKQLVKKQSRGTNCSAKQMSLWGREIKPEGSAAAMEEDDRSQDEGPAENSPDRPDVEDDGFSFPVPPLAADACIVPVYPIFGRLPFPAAPAAGEEEDEPETATVRVPLGRLLLEEREFRARQQDGRSLSARQREEEEEDDDDAASAGADEELEGVPPESYCLWAPGRQASPRRCRKSGSTGSVLRWRRISDRLVGRSHSDGKEKFVFLNAPGALPYGPANKQNQPEGGKGDVAGGAGRSLRYYGRGGGAGGSGRRQSYLPYKQELVGLFANVSGLRRSYHPF